MQFQIQSTANSMSWVLMMVYTTALVLNARALVVGAWRGKRPFPLLLGIYAPFILAAGWFGWLYIRVSFPAHLPAAPREEFRYPQLITALVAAGLPSAMRWIWRIEETSAKLQAERHERQEMLLQVQAQQTAQQRLIDELRKRIIDNVGHELRTPLTIVLGYLQLIRDGTFGPLPEALDQPLGTVSTQSRRIRIIVDRMIVMLRQPQPEPFDLGRLIGDVVGDEDVFLTTKRTPDEIAFEIVEENALIIEADMVMVKTAVYELINNAIKFREEAGFVRVLWYERDGNAIVQVQDDGIGIERRHYQRVFEPMIQLDNSSQRKFEGAGMGLAVVRQVAEIHGGYVEVRSEMGMGSSFVLSIPQAAIGGD